MPVMLAAGGHSYSAKVARELAHRGYCAAEKTRFHGVRLHLIAVRNAGRLPTARTDLAVPRLVSRLESTHWSRDRVAGRQFVRQFGILGARH